MTLSVVINSLRNTNPLVFCLTNNVVTNFTANALLAAGASPAMTNLPGEAGPFAKVAAAMLVNLGTPSTEQFAAIDEAIAGAVSAQTPWVLDPVAVGALPVRTEYAQGIVADRPTVIRGNASEILALAGHPSSAEGIDAKDTVTAAIAAGRDLAERYGSIVAISGQADAIISTERTVLVHTNGIELTRITGGGCALGAFTAAALAASDNPFSAVLAAHAFYGRAAERAAATSLGPGSFAVEFLDALALTDPSELDSVHLQEL